MNSNRHVLTLLRRFVAALLLCTVLSGGGSAVEGNELIRKWEELREKFDIAASEIRSKFEKDRSDLGGKFVGALQKLEAGLQEKGALDDLLAVQKERELFVKSGSLGSDGIADLSRLRTLYTESPRRSTRAKRRRPSG